MVTLAYTLASPNPFVILIEATFASVVNLLYTRGNFHRQFTYLQFFSTKVLLTTSFCHLRIVTLSPKVSPVCYVMLCFLLILSDVLSLVCQICLSFFLLLLVYRVVEISTQTCLEPIVKLQICGTLQLDK